MSFKVTKDPNAPKRAKSAWNFYLSEQYKNLKDSQQLTFENTVRQLRDTWKSYDDTNPIKQKYINLAKIDSIRYNNESKDYIRNNPIVNSKNHRRKFMKVTKLVKKTSGYNIFIKERHLQFKAENRNKPKNFNKSLTSIFANEWSNLPSEQKEIYNNKAKKNLEEKKKFFDANKELTKEMNQKSSAKNKTKCQKNNFDKIQLFDNPIVELNEFFDDTTNELILEEIKTSNDTKSPSIEDHSSNSIQTTLNIGNIGKHDNRSITETEEMSINDFINMNEDELDSYLDDISLQDIESIIKTYPKVEMSVSNKMLKYYENELDKKDKNINYLNKQIISQNEIIQKQYLQLKEKNNIINHLLMKIKMLPDTGLSILSDSDLSSYDSNLSSMSSYDSNLSSMSSCDSNLSSILSESNSFDISQIDSYFYESFPSISKKLKFSNTSEV